MFYVFISLCVQGGVKVLITGPWSEQSGRYSCVFDQTAVPASLIQPGVLRCYCPGTHAREPFTCNVKCVVFLIFTDKFPSLRQPTRPGWCVCRFWSPEVPSPRRSSSSIEPGMPARYPAPSSTGSHWTVSLQALPSHCRHRLSVTQLSIHHYQCPLLPEVRVAVVCWSLTQLS